MDGDDLLRTAISELVDESLDDPRIDPEKEIERIQRIVAVWFGDTYETRKQEREDSGVYESDDEN